MIFAAMFASLGLVEAQAGTGSALAVVAGVRWARPAGGCCSPPRSTGCAGRLQGPVFVWVNRVSGVALAAFGLWALVRAGAPMLCRRLRSPARSGRA